MLDVTRWSLKQITSQGFFCRYYYPNFRVSRGLEVIPQRHGGKPLKTDMQWIGFGEHLDGKPGFLPSKYAGFLSFFPSSSSRRTCHTQFRLLFLGKQVVEFLNVFCRISPVLLYRNRVYLWIKSGTIWCFYPLIWWQSQIFRWVEYIMYVYYIKCLKRNACRMYKYIYIYIYLYTVNMYSWKENDLQHISHD